MRYILLFVFLLAYFSGCNENTVNTNEDTIPPSIISIFPADSAININVDTPIFAVFSEKIDPVSATKYNIKFTTSGQEQQYSIVMKSDTLFIEPDSLLKYSTQYHVLFKTGIKDKAGNPLKEPKLWRFVTVADTDTTIVVPPDTTKTDSIPPVVTSVSPANGATGVSNSAVITVVFSEPVLNVSNATFTVKADGNPVAGNVALNGLVGTFTVNSPYPYSTIITSTLDPAIVDTTGNPLEEFSFSFTIEDEPFVPDTTPPEITATDPADGTVNVSANDTIYVTFSEPVQNLNGNTVFSYADGNPFYCTFYYNYGDTVASFVPNEPMPYGSNVEFVFTSGITDTAGNAMAEYHLNFTVEKNTPWTLFDYRYSIYTLDLDNSGNVFFGGYFESMPFVGKFLSNGELSWLNNINSTDDNGVVSVEFYNGYMYVLRFRYFNASLWDNIIEKVDPSDGTVIWSYNLNVNDRAVDMSIKDGYIFMALVDHLVRVDAESGLSQVDTYVSAGVISSIYAYNNSIYAAESYSLPGRGTEVRVEAYNYTLALSWSRSYGTVNYDGSSCLSVNSNGIYVVVSADGILDSRPFKMGLLKYDFNGTLLNDSLYSSIVADGELSSGITIDENGDIYTIYGPVKFSLTGEIIWDDFNSVHLYGWDIKYYDGKIFSANSSDHINIFDSGTGAQIFP